MTVEGIVKKHLKENGFDGLYFFGGGGCGCGADSLKPCGSFGNGCRPGYLHERVNNDCPESCELGCFDADGKAKRIYCDVKPICKAEGG